jgi:hypothetical protein
MVEPFATTLAGNNDAQIRDALESARGYFGLLLLIDTGITDATRRVAEVMLGERLVVESFAWCDDFAKARNFALEAAARHGADWAMTLDTDERLEFPGYRSKEDLVAALQSDPKVRVWLVMEKGGRYAKERFVRVGGQRSEVGVQKTEGGQVGDLPHLRWVGRVHEALMGHAPGESKVLPGVFFWEVKKSPEAYLAKLARDLVILQEETQAKPDDPRWWYYLGQTLEGLKRFPEAVEAFRKCAALPGWAEQAAWACYKGAECLCAQKEFAAAIELCALGLARQPGSPELAWLAGWCAYQAGKLREAIHWERMAIALGNVEGCRAGEGRISFRHLPGWYEGPYDVLRYAYLKLGDRRAAAKAEAKFREALERREGCTLAAAAVTSARSC